MTDEQIRKLGMLLISASVSLDIYKKTCLDKYLESAEQDIKKALDIIPVLG